MDFNKLLLKTAFSCMACDGEIVPEEVNLVKKIAENKTVFGDLNVEKELNDMLSEINIYGKGFLKRYLIDLNEQTFTKEQEYLILQIAADTIRADKKIEYSEIKFFKIIRSNLKSVSDTEILQKVNGIDESFLAKDINTSYMNLFDNYFDNIELRKFKIKN